MMRFQAAITSGLAAVVVPAVVLGEGSVETLEQTLAQTVRALEVLAGIEDSTATGDPRTVRLIRSATEKPILDDRLRDERLVDLRNQVNLLQGELDVLEAPAFLPETPLPLADTGDETLPAITTGLSEEALRALIDPETVAPVTITGPKAEASVADGPPTYSADPVAHARACYFAQRYARCLALTEELVNDAEALFWRSRALERLERLDEAIEAMKRSAELAGDGPEGRRARSEVEFLEWRRSFLADAPKRGGKQS